MKPLKPICIVFIHEEFKNKVSQLCIRVFVLCFQHITESLSDMKFRISPNAFFQVNTPAAEILYSKVAEWCNNTPNTTVLDICCGTGTIGQYIAKVGFLRKKK